MSIARSKLTSQGQISVPAEVRRKLGLSPGSVIEWVEEDGSMVVRPAAEYSWDEIRKALFPDGPPATVPLDAMKEGIRKAVRKRHARGRY
jgi:antitoxin PrlF